VKNEGSNVKVSAANLTLLGRQAVVCQAEHYRQERYLKEQRPAEGHRLFPHHPPGWWSEFVFCPSSSSASFSGRFWLLHKAKFLQNKLYCLFQFNSRWIERHNESPARFQYFLEQIVLLK